MKLLSLNILVGVSAIAAIYFNQQQVWSWFAVFKPLTTILIIAIPLLFGKRRPKKFFVSIVIGLFCCLMGDTLLLNNEYFIYGLLSFLVGHLVFMYGFTTIGGWKKYWKTLMLLLGISAAYLFYIESSLEDMLWPVVGYMLVIVLMSWQGIGLFMANNQKAFLYIAIGVVLFMISDSILSFNKFYQSFSGAGILVLTTYWAAIALLANSTVFVEAIDESLD